MPAISTCEELKMAIHSIQIKQTSERRLMKEQFLVTCETLKPGNPILGTIKEIILGAGLINILAVTVSGLASGYLSKFLIAGSSANFLRKVLTVIVQSGITGFISKRSQKL